MNHARIIVIATIVLLTSACATAPHLAQPNQLTAPTPIEGNTGKYMSPYTSDAVMADWVDKAVNAEMGGTIGGLAGAYAGQKMAENVPFIGGMLGKKVGDKLGREVAVKMSGGHDYIKETSDLSFHSMEDLAVWMYVNHSSHPHYQDALKSTQGIYPELKEGYMKALFSASARTAH